MYYVVVVSFVFLLLLFVCLDRGTSIAEQATCTYERGAAKRRCGFPIRIPETCNLGSGGSERTTVLTITYTSGVVVMMMMMTYFVYAKERSLRACQEDVGTWLD